MPDPKHPEPSVPFHDLSRDYAALREEIDRALAGVMRAGRFVLGEEGTAFESEFAAFCGVLHAAGVGNGTEAIQLILEASGIGRGDEVITTPLTAAFTALAIQRAGATPVFADVEPASLTLDPAAVRAAITPHTAAIVAVHLYGQIGHMEELSALAAQHHLLLVEDACQAHGAALGERLAGSLGHAGAFSFYPTKNLGAYGDAGMVVTADAELDRRVRALRHGGQTAHYRHELAGVNSRLDEVQAAILRTKLPLLETWNSRRRQIAAVYSSGLAQYATQQGRDSGGSLLTLPVTLPDRTHAWHLYAARTRRRDALRGRLAKQGVGTGVHYPIPLHLQGAFSSLDGRPGMYPCAEAAAREVVSLPLNPFLTDAEVAHVLHCTGAWVLEAEG